MFWIYFDFYIGPCLFAMLGGLDYIAREKAACDALTSTFEAILCLADVVALIETLAEGVTGCFQG